MANHNLTIIDSAFLALEQRTMPLHIGMLLLFRPPAGSEKGMTAKIADRLNRSLPSRQPARRRRFGRRVWVEDTDFDLTRHLTHIALPRPGRVRELLSLRRACTARTSTAKSRLGPPPRSEIRSAARVKLSAASSGRSPGPQARSATTQAFHISTNAKRLCCGSSKNSMNERFEWCSIGRWIMETHQ